MNYIVFKFYKFEMNYSAVKDISLFNGEFGMFWNIFSFNERLKRINARLEFEMQLCFFVFFQRFY